MGGPSAPAPAVTPAAMATAASTVRGFGAGGLPGNRRRPGPIGGAAPRPFAYRPRTPGGGRGGKGLTQRKQPADGRGSDTFPFGEPKPPAKQIIYFFILVVALTAGWAIKSFRFSSSLVRFT